MYYHGLSDNVLFRICPGAATVKPGSRLLASSCACYVGVNLARGGRGGGGEPAGRPCICSCCISRGCCLRIEGGRERQGRKGGWRCPQAPQNGVSCHLRGNYHAFPFIGSGAGHQDRSRHPWVAVNACHSCLNMNRLHCVTWDRRTGTDSYSRPPAAAGATVASPTSGMSHSCHL